MKKSFKVLLTMNIICWIGFFGLLVIEIVEDPVIGSWIVDMYGEMTNEYGHTVPGMYDRLTELLVLAGGLLLCLDIPVAALGVIAYKSKEDSEMTNENERVKAKKSFRIKKEKKVKKEVVAEQPVVEEVKKETKREAEINQFLNGLRKK